MERGKIATQFIDLVSTNSKETLVFDVRGEVFSVREGFSRTIGIIENCCDNGGKLLFIGNGGSAAIASHQALDYWKNGKLKALAFNDASLLTALSNDLGYEHVFSTPIESFADEGDVLIAISSSGQSQNILNGVLAAKQKKCRAITFSGFNADNPLKKMGDLNFYVPSSSYGVVEVTHLTLIHAILEDRMEHLAGGKKE